MRVLFSCAILLLSLSFVNCDSDKKDDPQPQAPFNYLALGDSYTIGQSVDSVDRYPAVLVEQLRVEGLEFDSLKFIAKTGWSTDELDAAIDLENPASDYDLVSLLIGVNNQYRGYPIEDYELEFEQLLDRAISFARGDASKVFVVSIPDYAFTPFGQTRPNPENISLELDNYNQINKTISESKGILYFNITPISRLGLEQTDLVATDNLHPSGEQYRRWADLMVEEVKNLLEK